MVGCKMHRGNLFQMYENLSDERDCSTRPDTDDYAQEHLINKYKDFVASLRHVPHFLIGAESGRYHSRRE